jgi:hypothetical protein
MGRVGSWTLVVRALSFCVGLFQTKGRAGHCPALSTCVSAAPGACVSTGGEAR